MNIENDSLQFNFTQKQIESIEIPEKKWIDYRDTKTRFLVLRVSNAGRKTFYYVRKWNGKLLWIKLDTFPEMNIYQARERCNEISSQISEGIDPTESKRKRRDALTLGELYEIYMKMHSKPHKRSWRTDVVNYKNHLARWNKKALIDITTELISKLHKKIGDESGHIQANRTIALLKSMFTFAIKQGLYEGMNPGMRVTFFKETSRDRFLEGDELLKFFQALETEPNLDMKDFFMLALFTGARRGNLQSMKWKDIDFYKGIWTIQASESKNADSMKVILAPEAIDILKNRKRCRTLISEFVFPSTGKMGHITEPKRAWKNLLKRAGIENLRIHDLRRTLGSWQAASGSSLNIIGKSLGHKNLNTTAIYARLNLDPVRESVNNAVSAMVKIAKNIED